MTILMQRHDILTLAFLCCVTATPNVAAGAPPSQAASVEQPPNQSALRVGDQIKVSFYERLAQNDDKWSDGSRPDQSFYLHAELSGTYTIDQSLNVSFPLLGSLPVGNRSISEVEAAVSQSFSKLLGHPGFVNLTIAERAPVYVIGRVNHPGVYKYESGLTPLHLVALAGGLRAGDEDKWTVVEAVREAGRLEAKSSRLARLMAQLAVLKAELNGSTEIRPPQSLIEMVGVTSAQSLIRDESARRIPVVQARNEHHHALQIAISTAQKVAEIDNARLGPLQSSLDGLQNRVTGLQQLLATGNVDKILIAQAQTELINAADRKATAETSIAEDQNKLADAVIAAARADSEMKAELGNEIATRQQEIDALIPDTAASAGVARLLRQPARLRSEAVQFQIVRASKVIDASETTSIQSGDLVRVQSSSEPDDGTPMTDPRQGMPRNMFGNSAP
jgi:polysaccharide biosynthesis/export protein ExoF